MIDVAQLAGVSHQTVSRVLNDHPHVREETRVRVLDAMLELGYRRNLTARALATRRTDTIGVIAFDTTLYGPARTLFSIEQAARARGYVVHMATVPDPEEDAFSDALRRLLEQSVTGVVVLAPQRAAVRVMGGLPADLAAVAVEGGAVPGLPSVVVDQVDGAVQATVHLLELGHREVVHVRGREDWIEASARHQGWQQALVTAGVAVRPALPGDWSARSGHEAGRRLLAEHPGVTAVFCANDHMALGLVRALTEAGVSVPHDVSVVGFDDIAEAEFLCPPLTTVHQDFAEVGRRCVDVLLERVEADGGWFDGPPVVVPSELVVRASTAPPGAGIPAR
ncbi:LacI family DNA-binding transcriptional regulator [Modestobacter sp. I12A-02628]|uniref:LacI family DNA-binding transcriptional regulator n=1 Tax=Goekera deserti TaxID=2497753 RepID=A0A7K3WCB5_9ACTN|nr:LacI family DNA-binding transcriptional regulator [Goekera deserti]MPQ98532.1 LacI family DNA-binding transcriptional regulator [Goekera deserti]NDI48363.1 substrate-binding domain-containing protein [Goekera deserti]NEL54112.1 LacI family DNA-binding transcriptional regulator [Goekera deserti]